MRKHLLDGKLHREDGPALELSDGSKSWYSHGVLHREDGAAVEYANGFKMYFLHGKQIFVDSDEEFLRLIKLRLLW